MADERGFYPTPAERSGNGFATSGLLCGIAALFVLWPVLGPLAVGFGATGWSQANRGDKGKGPSITAVVLGLLAIALWLLAYTHAMDKPRYFVW